MVSHGILLAKVHSIPSDELRCRKREAGLIDDDMAASTAVACPSNSFDEDDFASFMLGTDVDLGLRGGGGGIKSAESLRFGGGGATGIQRLFSNNGTGA